MKTIAILVMSAVRTFAHDGVDHVLGTVKTIAATTITVETTKHENIAVTVDPATTFRWKGAKASLNELKPGERVAIDCKHGVDKKLHAISARWGATPAAK